MIRKLFTNNFFAFFLIVPFTLCFFSSLFSPVFVSAAGNVNEFLVFNGSSSVSDTVKNNLSLNSTFTDGCVFCKYDSGFNVYFFMCDLDSMYSETGSNGWKYYSNYNSSGARVANCHEYDGDASSRNYDFSNINNNVNAQYVLGFNNSSFIICYTSVSLTSGLSLESICQNSTTNDSWPTRLPAKRPDLKYCVIYPSLVFYDPDEYQVVNPFFSLDVDDFYTWLVNNDKIQVSGDSGGVSVGGKIPSYIGVQKLKSFLTFYKNFGSSNQSFVRHIVDWFSFMNIASQTKDNINILKSTTDLLYQEYINYRSGTHAYWPTATKIQKRQNIDTVTDDDNTILITDDNSDTLDISLLRDILRGVIAISNNLIDGVSKIVSALNQLDFTVNVANDGGVGFSASDIWGSGDITESENYLALTAAFMDKGVDVSAAENMKINYLDNATQIDSFTVSVVMPDQFVNGQFTEKTVTHTIDNTSKMYNTLILFRKLIAFAVVAYFAIRIRFELPHLIRGE